MATLRPMVRGRREFGITRIPLREGFRVGVDEPAGLPPGRYLSITIDVHPDYGGQTRALLMRNRILARHGANADVLMVGATKTSTRRETLRERGLLSDDIDLLNIYEHYRDTDWPGEEPRTRSHRPQRVRHPRDTLPDGSPWRRIYRLTDGR